MRHQSNKKASGRYRLDAHRKGPLRDRDRDFDFYKPVC